jgi:hypothetical protein
MTTEQVSYDDEDTLQQKVQYANSQGLGGLMIWAVDLDTPDLRAMSGLIYPKQLNQWTIGNNDYWDDATPGICKSLDPLPECPWIDLLTNCFPRPSYRVWRLLCRGGDSHHPATLRRKQPFPSRNELAVLPDSSGTRPKRLCLERKPPLLQRALSGRGSPNGTE